MCGVITWGTLSTHYLTHTMIRKVKLLIIHALLTVVLLINIEVTTVSHTTNVLLLLDLVL